MSTAVTAVAEGGPTGPVPPAFGRLLPNLLTLVRPHQWTKNLFVIPLALLDAPQWTVAAALRVGWAVVLFTLASCLVYVLNDIADRGLDRVHPDKCSRPVAAGTVSLLVAWAYAGVLAGLLAVAVLAGQPVQWWPLGAYVLLQLAYSSGLKHVALVDVCLVSGGFALRLAQGYAAVGIPASGWLLAAVFSGCLLLILGKRRHELAVAGATHRPALSGYTVALVDHLIGLSATVAVTATLLYLGLDAPVGPYQDVLLVATLPLVVLGVFRYLQAVLVLRLGGDPVRTLLRDRLLLADATLLTAIVLAVLVAAHYPRV